MREILVGMMFATFLFAIPVAAQETSPTAEQLAKVYSMAEQGSVEAQLILAGMYSVGDGVPQNYVKAVKWYGLAAEQGSAEAQLHIGISYELGTGVPEDFSRAAQWYRLAAEQGYADAQWTLGRMYTIGRGVPQDYVEAHKWFNLAAARGHKFGPKARDRIAEKMSSEQIAEAQRLAREWKPKGD